MRLDIKDLKNPALFRVHIILNDEVQRLCTMADDEAGIIRRFIKGGEEGRTETISGGKVEIIDPENYSQISTLIEELCTLRKQVK